MNDNSNSVPKSAALQVRVPTLCPYMYHQFSGRMLVSWFESQLSHQHARYHHLHPHDNTLTISWDCWSMDLRRVSERNNLPTYKNEEGEKWKKRAELPEGYWILMPVIFQATSHVAPMVIPPPPSVSRISIPSQTTVSLFQTITYLLESK